MKARFLLLTFTTILLSACAATHPAPLATPKVMVDTVAPKASSTPTIAVTVTVQAPTETPIPVETIEIDLTDEAQNARATKTAKFSVNCQDFYAGKNDLSPDENWLAITCGTKRNQTLEIVHQDGRRWVLQYADYVPKGFGNNGGIGNLDAVYWSSDHDYLYFTSYIGFDGGGTCFYGYGIHGLFRIGLNTGTVSTVLPATDSFPGYYITFSPTGRRLAYQGNGNYPTILDLQTGSETVIDPGKHTEYQSTGDLTWSPDGLELAYSICKAAQVDENNYSIKKSAIKIFSIKQQVSRTILEIEKAMLLIENWDSADTLEIRQNPYGFADDGMLQLLNLKTHQLMTPTPEN